MKSATCLRIVCAAFLALQSALASSCEPRQKLTALVAGNTRLSFNQIALGRYGLSVGLEAAQPSFEQKSPMAIELVDAAGKADWLSNAYSEVRRERQEIVCSGSITSPGGSRFQFADRYRVQAGERFEIERQVTVLAKGAGDAAFSSRFSLIAPSPTRITDCDVLMPGVWYGQNTHVPPTALASHLDDRTILVREDRLPFPLLALRQRNSSVTLSLLRVGGLPDTFAGEDGLKRLIDARMQFGSLGFASTTPLEPAFQYPGTEGERTYVYGPSVQGDRWALRSHPIAVGFNQTYRLQFGLSLADSFPEVVKSSWSAAYTQAACKPGSADLNKVYSSSLALLSAVCQPYHGTISLPFAVRVPTGEAYDTICQMGFVGDALPAAALILRYGIETDNSAVVRNAEQLIDYWVHNSRAPSGVLRTWYDVQPDGKVTWRGYPMYLRVAGDGITGLLQAWSVERKRGMQHPEWLAFCKSWADWLLTQQSAEGSWSRSYSIEGAVLDRSADTTIRAIRPLVDMYAVTHDTRYRDAAQRAGEFCWQTVHRAYAYVGGTPDNPNVADKEAGMLSLDAFLALYDLNAEPRWLQAAEQSAWYAETWVYLRDIPMPAGDPEVIFPKGRSTVGLSLIATGHSGADNYMAASPFLFYRLSLLTGETHFRDSASMLLRRTKQIMDWDGSLGYARFGLLTEALTLGPVRGHGVKSWLPWLSVTIAEPLARLKDTYGAMDTEQIEKSTIREVRVRRTKAFGLDRGLARP